MQIEADPDSEWVSRLAHVDRSVADAALREAQAERSLFQYLSRMHRLEGRQSYIEIEAPLELYAFVRLLRPKHVVEVGVSSGVSSAYLLKAMDRNGEGTLHSIDLPKHEVLRAGSKRSPNGSWSLPPGRSPGWAVPFALRKRWDLRLGDKREVVPFLAAELPSIGLFVYDVPHVEEQAAREFREIDRRLPEGGVAIADHGPHGEVCAPLRRWSKSREGIALGRTGVGLYGFRCERGTRRRVREN